MRVWIYSPYDTRLLARAAREAGHHITKTRPSVVVTYGGDGTIIEAERIFPGIPKLALRHSSLCSQCIHYPLSHLVRLFARVRKGTYNIRTWEKIEASVGKKKIIGLNEIQLHNIHPVKSLRFRIRIGRKTTDLIGDGFVAATAYGSSAYYEALGYHRFSRGIRIGFNNTKPKPAALRLKASVSILITRETGMLFADNDSKGILVKEGTRVTLRKSKRAARFLVFS